MLSGKYDFPSKVTPLPRVTLAVKLRSSVPAPTVVIQGAPLYVELRDASLPAAQTTTIPFSTAEREAIAMRSSK
ncbi:hypothetical protein GQ457_08G037370 [Hibiscus cannabinus]